VVKQTQVVIVGAGPAGLLLGCLLDRAGIDNIILERQTKDYVLARIRAGILEQTSVDLLTSAGAGARLAAEGIAHHAVNIAFDDRLVSVPLGATTNGKVVTAYGQTEVTLDLCNLRAAGGSPTIYSAENVEIDNFDRDRPFISFIHNGEAIEIACDLIAGDAAHVVPPTGAKGLNLAFSDIYYLHQAIESFFADNDIAALPHYSQQALARVWKTERFSWYLTNLTHRFNADPFEQKMKEVELDYITASPAGRLMMAENYVGLPL
jgi:2-polyprenyl-6-methoxyphenol hydroxylase-like FAD-dependent oxidoreductase